MHGTVDGHEDVVLVQAAQGLGPALDVLEAVQAGVLHGTVGTVRENASEAIQA